MRGIFVGFLLLLPVWSFAQIREISLVQSATFANLPNARTEALSPITLPFWDDFSTSTGTLDTAWWMPGSPASVLARPGNGISPPTLNVVTFDGVDANGNPYSPSGTYGNTDSLVSRIIDLTQVPTNLRGSVYLSFFFQKRGNGNPPEPEDSLLLYFKKADGNWKKVWPTATDIVPDDPTVFTEKLVNVPNSVDYFHPDFQFKFQAKGRQNGWFDNWNIDYVYMDKRRNASDNSYLDRAITEFPASILGYYTAMPFDEFMSSGGPATYLSATSTWVRTLENDTQPVEYTATIKDTLNDTVLETIAQDVELLMFPKDLKEAPSMVPNPANFDPNADSLFLQIEYYVRTGDKNLIDSIYNAGLDTVFYDHINLRVNDTARTYVTIHDYFSYDDGSAEYGAGINQPSGRIACQFVTQNPHYIDRIDIYFPNISRNQAGTPIDVFVLKDIDNINNPYEGLLTTAIQHEGINQFSSYNFPKPVLVQDTFYIGFVNNAADEVWTAVGLDKNTDTGDKIFYSISSSWEQNTSIRGSLMIRPHFSEEVVSGVEPFVNPLHVYPNPTHGTLYLEGYFDKMEIFDAMGRPVAFSFEHSATEKTATIEILNRKPGIVVLRYFRQGQVYTQKLLLTSQ